MRRRIRNYVAVVMSLLLCIGLWFQHGEKVRAAQTATVYIIADDANRSQVTINSVDISGVNLEVSEDGIVNSAEGTFSLSSEQIKLNGRTPFGIYPTVDRIEGTQLNEQSIDANGLRITSSADTGGIIIELYGVYGASHKVTYDSNYQMGGNITSSIADVVAEEMYYQADLTLTAEKYTHPSTPTFNNTTWTNTVTISNSDNTTRDINYFFVGWGITDSGGVNAPTGFEYADKEETAATFYAQWQRPCLLMINYYQTKAEMQNQNTYGDPVTIVQESLEDTSFTFTTMSGVEMDGEFFAAWQYEDESGAAVTLAENEEKTIAIPQDGTDVILNLYGLWSPAAKLQVIYDQGDMLDPYIEEVQQASISDTTFSFETFRDAAPPTDYSIFEGWSYTNASDATVIIGAGEICSDIPITTTAVTMTAVWKEPLLGGSTVSAGTHTLREGESYTLGSGSWTVTYNGSGDSCTYTGGREFYVATTGDYTFTAK